MRERHGVDLNRNFSVAWGGAGSSGNQRAENYRGAYAFSEPESAAIRALARPASDPWALPGFDDSPEAKK